MLEGKRKKDAKIGKNSKKNNKSSLTLRTCYNII